MGKRKVFELSVAEVKIEHGGTVRSRGTSKRLLLAGLLWPRPAIAERNAVMPLEFDAALSVALEERPWTERILFKEPVEGPFGISVAITEKLTEKRIAEFLAFLGQAAMNAALKNLAGMDVLPTVTAVLQSPFKLAQRTLGRSASRDPRIVAAGTIDMADIAAEWQTGKEYSIRIPLTAPDDIVSKTATQRDGKPRRRTKTLMKAGADNGAVVLRGMLYS